MRRPSLKGYREFREQYPQSPLLASIRPAVEDFAFDSARRAGTLEAYAAFEEQFPDGPHARRVAGNVAYLKEISTAAVRDPAVLRAFAETHPESDFANEARRSVEALLVRDRTRFPSVLLSVDLAEGTPDASRIRAAFRERAAESYEGAGLELLVPSNPKYDAASGSPGSVTLRIRHREEAEAAQVRDGGLSQAGLMARTDVTLQRAGEPEPIWHREFVVRVPPQEIIAGASVLFASKQAALYWDSFFVPVATWQSSSAVRSPHDAKRPLAAVDAAGGRAVAMFEDGTFDLYELADPEQPLRVAHYERSSNIEHFEGVRIHEDRIILYGEDGLEIIRFGDQGLAVDVTRSRADVGSINALLPLADGLLLSSSRGLVVTDATGASPKRVMRRALLGLDGAGEMIVFADGETVYVTTLELLRSGRVLEQLRLGREFGPGRVRVHGDVAVVMGQGGVALIELRGLHKPRLVARLERSVAGEVRDSIRVAGRIALVGSRGLLLLDPSHGRIVEFVDVSPRSRLALTGRHLVVVGGSELQVVDVLPFTSAAVAPASAGAAPR